ncbi:MAG: hypothetical protein IPM47_19530 [Sphingobacteriales bacterium]|nr:MAG: hypothetical protein IPM47_19530 [Sphingobacteriales bacterium]
MQKQIYFYLLFVCFVIFERTEAQTPAIQQSKLYGSSNLLRFEADNLPPLTPVNPHDYRRQSRRTFFWKFGDGGFSFEQSPIHTYREAGQYTAVMESTRIYSDDDIDDSAIDRASAPVNINFNTGFVSKRPNNDLANLEGSNIRLLTNRSPRSGDSITYIITYQNTCPFEDSGSLIFLFNADQLNLKYSESFKSELSATSDGQIIWTFDSLAVGHQRNIFISMATDTTVHPSDTILTHLVIQSTCSTDTFSLLKTAVKSHDPNRKSVFPDVLCPGSAEPLCYTIEFQNFGSGPAETIQIRDYLSVFLNAATFLPVESSHPDALVSVTPPSPNRLVTWQFIDINLPGTQQAGYGTTFTDKDTKGYVKFCIMPALPLDPCSVIPNQAEIIFDCNLPIPTNTCYVTVQQPGCTDCCQQCPNTMLSDFVNIPHFGGTTAMAQVFCPGSGSPSSGIRYQWYPEVFLEVPNIPQFLFFDTDGNIPAITYTLTVWNPVLCWYAVDSITVYMGGCFNGDTLSIDQVTATDPSCPGADDASLNLLVSGGDPPYTLYSFNGCFAVSNNFSIPLDDLPPGIFPIAIEDANGCIVRDTFQIANPISLWVDEITTDATCCSCPDGESALLPSGGVPPYVYLWQNGAADSLETGLLPGTYSYTVTDSENCQFISSVQVQHPAKLQLTVLLEGGFNYDTQLMRTDLNDFGLLPANQPFNQSPWNYAGTETLPNSLPPDVTDWVLVEFRTTPETVAVQMSAMIWNNGNITNTWAETHTAGLYVCGITTTTPYYIVVRHRNHLAVISSSTIVFNNNPVYDFTTSAAQALGANQLIQVAFGKFALYAGDLNADGVITVSDFNLYTQQSSSVNQYLAADINLDKFVTVADFNLYLPNASLIGYNAVRY